MNLIKREQAVKIIDEIDTFCAGWRDYAISRIKNLYHLQEKTGKWIECEIVPDKESIADWQRAQCSMCGKWHTTPYLYSFDYYNFCPNCGARMEHD